MSDALLFRELPDQWPALDRRPRPEDVEKDVQAIVWSMKLHGIRRFYRQHFWLDESRAADMAVEAEGELGLENVSAHSWHVADIVLLLADHFRPIDAQKCLSLAIIHDKLEIITGDYDPIGASGDGRETHAFNPSANLVKLSSERIALRNYIGRLRIGAQQWQKSLFQEFLEGSSKEARLVKAVDKLQSLVFVYLKKNGDMDDRHLAFTLKYAAKSFEYFPEIRPYYDRLTQKIMHAVDRERARQKSKGLAHQLELGL